MINYNCHVHICMLVNLQKNARLIFFASASEKSGMWFYQYLQFLGDPAKQEAPQEETPFVRSSGRSAVHHDLSSKAYNSASLRPIALKFWT